jgi:hypothetical protein
MNVKEQFNLIKGVDNILSVSESTLNRYAVEKGPRKVFVVLELEKNKINHFAKKRVFDLISFKSKRERLKIVSIDKYIFPVTYNKTTKDIIINVKAFGVNDVVPTNPGPMNLYACLVYGIVFSDIVSGRKPIPDRYASVITNFLTSILLRAFGKDYGLLGSFSREIVKLKFLLNCYVLASFFGMKPPTLYKRAGVASAFDYRTIEGQLKPFDFTNINEFIKALNVLGVMPNINRHIFTAKMMKRYTINFLPALEDIARYFAVLTTATVPSVSTSVVPAYIYKYNERDFNNAIEFTKGLFR